jgi:hypothetical protein
MDILAELELTSSMKWFSKESSLRMEEGELLTKKYVERELPSNKIRIRVNFRIVYD